MLNQVNGETHPALARIAPPEVAREKRDNNRNRELYAAIQDALYNAPGEWVRIECSAIQASKTTPSYKRDLVVSALSRSDSKVVGVKAVVDGEYIYVIAEGRIAEAL
jgi:hypothetical protein